MHHAINQNIATMYENQQTQRKQQLEIERMKETLEENNKIQRLNFERGAGTSALVT